MKKLLFVLMCLISAVAIAGPANSLTLGVNEFIGKVVPGTPADPSSELLRVNYLIGLYNGNETDFTPDGYTFTLNPGSSVPPPDLLLATDPVSFPATDAGLPFNLATSYLYLLAKFGNEDWVYYLDFGPGPIDFSYPEPGSPALGLSHLTFFNPTPTQVPEPATLMLLGIGLVGVYTCRRFIKR